MTIDTESRMRRANPLTHQDQLANWFGSDVTERHLRELLAGMEGRMTERKQELGVAPDTEVQSAKPTPNSGNTRRQKRQGLIAAALIVVIAIGVVLLLPTNESTPPATDTAVTSPPTSVIETATPLSVANGYMTARAAHDGVALSMMFAPEPNIDDFVSSPDEYVAEAQIDDATGWSYLEVNCAEPDPAQPNAVTCTYLMQNDWGRTLGVGPFDGSRFSFAIKDGKITGLTHLFDTSEFSDQLWNPMKRWVAINYPDDIDLMYVSEGEQRKDPAAIELWRQRTEEFVALGGANLDQ